MTSQTSTSKLMNIMARIRFVLAMVKVCKFYILVLLTFPHLTEISLFLISYTFLTFKRMYFQLINLLMIIRFSLNFTLIFFRVKDLHSGKLLLQSPSKGGLYPWPSFPFLKSAPTALIGEKSLHTSMAQSSRLSCPPVGSSYFVQASPSYDASQVCSALPCLSARKTPQTSFWFHYVCFQ